MPCLLTALTMRSLCIGLEVSFGASGQTLKWLSCSLSTDCNLLLLVAVAEIAMWRSARICASSTAVRALLYRVHSDHS